MTIYVACIMNMKKSSIWRVIAKAADALSMIVTKTVPEKHQKVQFQ